ncbi:MAG: phosphate ABC transporter permease PstA [Spirulinaceae cyanobacterium]
MASRLRFSDWCFRLVGRGCAIAVILLVLGITVQLLIPALPAIQTFGWGFLAGTEWNPVSQVYGILPQIYGTLVSALLALGLAVPTGIAIAVFLQEELAPAWLSTPLAFLIELLAAIPSVVYGLWGIFVLIPALMPLLRGLHQTLGWLPWLATPPGQRGLLPTIVVLVLMILPIIVGLSRDALAALPAELRQGAAAVGANRWETIVWLLLPASFSGIVGAAVLALGRALGETMAAVMLIGNANQISASLLAPASTIAALIANQFAEARDLQVAALLYAALVLMAITLLINMVATLLIEIWPIWHRRLIQAKALTRSRFSPQATGAIAPPPQTPPSPPSSPTTWQPPTIRRRLLALLLHGVCSLATAIAVVAMLSILLSLLTQGFSRFDLAALTQLPPAPLDLGGGFRNALVGTLVMVSLGASFSAPLGVGVAIYLVEIDPDQPLAQWVRFFNGVLSGVPSVLCGLFAYALVVLTTGSFSAIAGGLALAVVMLPLMVRAAEEGLKAVANELREGAIALGSSQWQTTSRIVLPAAAPAIATGLVLATARAAGETAPLLFTALFSQYGFNGLTQPVASLSVLIYNFALSPYGNYQALAWTGALVIVGLILGVSLVARHFARSVGGG